MTSLSSSTSPSQQDDQDSIINTQDATQIAPPAWYEQEDRQQHSVDLESKYDSEQEEEDEAEEDQHHEEEEVNIVSATVAPVMHLSSVNASPASSLPPRPVLKRPATAYFLFCAEQRESAKASVGASSVTAVAKLLGEKWKALTQQEKQDYQQRAKQQKVEYDTARKEQDALYGPAVATSTSAAASSSSSLSLFAGLSLSPKELVVPHAHIKRLLHLDGDIKRTSKECQLTLSKCTELFVSFLSYSCARTAQLDRRRTIRMQDVIQVVESMSGMEFIKGEMKKVQKEIERLQKENKQQQQQQTGHTDREQEDKAAERTNDGNDDAEQAGGEDKENDKENLPVFSSSSPSVRQTQQKPTRGRRKTQDAAAAEDPTCTGAAVASSKGGTKRKASGSSKKALDPAHYQSLTAMFSRMEKTEKLREEHKNRDDDDDSDDNEVVDSEPLTRTAASSEDAVMVDNDEVEDEDADTTEQFALSQRKRSRTRRARVVVANDDSEEDDNADPISDSPAANPSIAETDVSAEVAEIEA